MLAVHTDHDHIHAHIIFNNTNAYNGLSFTTEENQGGRRERAWAKLREISDEICNENKLSVITEPEKSTGISHYERDMQIEGKSWKEKLRYKLAKIIVKSDSFEDFLRRCDKKNIEVVYAPNHKYKLKYRLEGQQKFIRGETLGEFYTADAIAEQIKILSKVTAKTERKAVAEPVVAPPKTPTTPSVTAPKTEPKPVITEQKPSEKKKDKWADIRGLRNVDAMIAELEAAGVDSLDVLRSFFWNTKHNDDHSTELVSLKAQMKAIDTLIAKMNHRDELAPIYKEYQGKSGWAQSRFKKKNADAIEDYEQTIAYIKEYRKPFMMDGKPPTVFDFMDQSNKLKTTYNTLLEEHSRFIAKKTTAEKYVKTVRSYLLKKEVDRQNAQTRQRNLTQQKKNYLE